MVVKEREREKEKERAAEYLYNITPGLYHYHPFEVHNSECNHDNFAVSVYIKMYPENLK